MMPYFIEKKTTRDTTVQKMLYGSVWASEKGNKNANSSYLFKILTLLRVFTKKTKWETSNKESFHNFLGFWTLDLISLYFSILNIAEFWSWQTGSSLIHLKVPWETGMGLEGPLTPEMGESEATRKGAGTARRPAAVPIPNLKKRSHSRNPSPKHHHHHQPFPCKSTIYSPPPPKKRWSVVLGFRGMVWWWWGGGNWGLGNGNENESHRCLGRALATLKPQTHPHHSSHLRIQNQKIKTKTNSTPLSFNFPIPIPLLSKYQHSKEREHSRVPGR
jgi:hypothetical protein